MATMDSPSPGRIDGRTHLLPVRVYYEDTDFSGLVYHANYLRFFERGRSDFLRAVGIDHVALLAQDTAITLVSIAVSFRAGARIDEALLVRTQFDAIEGPRFIISQRIERGGALVAEAAVAACCISQAGRAKRPPALLVDKIKPYLDPAPSPF
jgi:acyl-CoA thioester hydrolase